MYTEQDRVSTARVLITLGVIAAVALIAVVLANAWLGSALKPAPVAMTSDVETTARAAQATEPTVAPVAPAAVGSVAVALVTPEVDAQPLAEPEPEPEPAVPAASGGVVGTVVIDAGHQKRGDSSLEPIGPGASERKPKVAGGARGVATGNPEGEITLEVAKRLRDELEARGVKVIMVRTTQDVNIANSKRAKIANDAKADLFVRLHCDGASSSSAKGLSTLIPGKNRWTGPIVTRSKAAGSRVHKAVIAATGANDRGLKTRTDLSGFNWSKVPTVLVEMGFMSNSAEDRKLATAAYQEKLAKGMANGIVDYLESR